MEEKDETLEFLKEMKDTSHDIGNSIPRMKDAIKAFCRVFDIEDPNLDYEDYKTRVHNVIPETLFFLLGLVEVVRRAYQKLTAEIVSGDAIECENGDDSEMEEDHDAHEDSKQEENNDDQEEVEGAGGSIPSTSDEVASFQMLMNDFYVPGNMVSDRNLSIDLDEEREKNKQKKKEKIFIDYNRIKVEDKCSPPIYCEGSDKPMYRKSDFRLTSWRMNSNGVLTPDIVTGPFGFRGFGGFGGFGSMNPVEVHGFKIKDEHKDKRDRAEEIIDEFLGFVNSEIEETERNLQKLKEGGNKDDSKQGENNDDSEQGENSDDPEEVDGAAEPPISLENLVVSDKNVPDCNMSMENDEEREKNKRRRKERIHTNYNNVKVTSKLNVSANLHCEQTDKVLNEEGNFSVNTWKMNSNGVLTKDLVSVPFRFGQQEPAEGNGESKVEPEEEKEKEGGERPNRKVNLKRKKRECMKKKK